MHYIKIAPPGAEAALQAFIVPDTPEAIAMAVEALIERLDAMDGDPDIEANGDELDGNGSEEDFMHHGMNCLGEPGCPIADAGEHNGDYEGIDEREEEHV